MSAVEPSLICIPPASSNAPALYTRSAALDSNDVIVLEVGQPFTKLALVRWKIKYAAGTAANFTPYIFSEVGVTTAGHISQEAAGTATAVATLFDPEITDAPIEMQADYLGRLYMMIGPDAGADNTFDYMLKFLKRL